MDAYDHLINKGIQALFFPSTTTIASSNLLDVHQLHYLRHNIPDNDIIKLLPPPHKTNILNLSEDISNAQYRYDTSSSAKLKYYINFCLDPEQRKILLNSIFEVFNFSQSIIAKNLYMNRKDLIKLAKTSSIGSHAHSHRPLATLAKNDLHSEVVHSKTILENITEKTIRGISYPYEVLLRSLTYTVPPLSLAILMALL